MKWCDNKMMTGPFYVLVLNEAEYHKAMRRMRVPKRERSAWVNPGSRGTVTKLTNEEGELAVIVAVEVSEQDDQLAVFGILVHEAVHVFQIWCEHIGEREPSSEFEAYSIQKIAQELMTHYATRTNMAFQLPGSV